jgi:hypothetical protein
MPLAIAHLKDGSRFEVEDYRTVRRRLPRTILVEMLVRVCPTGGCGDYTYRTILIPETRLDRLCVLTRSRWFSPKRLGQVAMGYDLVSTAAKLAWLRPPCPGCRGQAPAGGPTAGDPRTRSVGSPSRSLGSARPRPRRRSKPLAQVSTGQGRRTSSRRAARPTS